MANINELFDGLLDISKLDAGGVAPALADVALAPILQRVHARYADDADAKGIRLRLAPTRAWVRTDPQLLERIVQNLVGNAVRYTPRGGVVIGCRPRGDSVRVEVWDSGVGIAQDQQRQVFAEFFQAAGERSLRSEGLGLGLAIVERLCTLLHHPIDLRSAAGAGTRMAVTLPRAEPQLQRAPAIPSSPAPAASHEPLRGRRVLVVDDDDLVLQGARGLLESWGCSVVTAASVAQALEHLAGRAPDLVISDFHLGGGERAADVVAALRASFGRDPPTILVSGDVSAPTRQHADQLGLPLLDKPVRPMALRALASRLLAEAPVSALPGASRAA